jgi:flagellar basal body-associated protein FliL
MKLFNKKGSTSVLIILLMVVLMVFGLTILTTTLSNKSLSEKKRAWVKDYYDLETQVAVQLADLDKEMMSLKEKAAKEEIKLVNLYMNIMSLETIDDEYYTEFIVSEEKGDYLKHIAVKLQLNMDLKSHVNYKIVKYSETQDLFEYEDIKFGNPFFPDKDD